MEDLFILALVIIGIFFLIQRLVHRGYEHWFSPQGTHWRKLYRLYSNFSGKAIFKTKHLLA